MLPQQIKLLQAKAGAESPATAGTIAQLGLNLLLQKKHADAEKLLRDCLRVYLYDATGKQEEVARWRKNAEETQQSAAKAAPKK